MHVVAAYPLRLRLPPVVMILWGAYSSDSTLPHRLSSMKRRAKDWNLADNTLLRCNAHASLRKRG